MYLKVDKPLSYDFVSCPKTNYLILSVKRFHAMFIWILWKLCRVRVRNDRVKFENNKINSVWRRETVTSLNCCKNRSDGEYRYGYFLGKFELLTEWLCSQ